MKNAIRAAIGLRLVILHGAFLLLAAPGGLAAPIAVDGPEGGTIVSSPLSGAASGPGAFKDGLHALRGYFDEAPAWLGAVRSKDGNVTIAAFRAVRRGAPVGGLAIAAYDPAGHSRFAVVFDDPARLARSLPPMLNRLKEMTQETLEQARPAQAGTRGPDFAAFEAAAAHVALRRIAFPDGTATIGIADGFTPAVMSGGRFGASAADGAYANFYTPVPLLDPRSALYQQESRMSGGNPPQIPGQTVIAYDPDPVAVWKQVLRERAEERGEGDPSPQMLRVKPLPNDATGFLGRMVAGTMTLHGEPYVFSGTLLVSPPPRSDGSWLLQITMRGAPAAHAAADMPALIAMQRSEKIDMNAVRDQTMRNIAAINAECSRWLAANKAAGDDARNRVFQTSMHNAQVAQDNIDRSTAGFIHYINDEAVVQHDPTGARGTISASLATALQKSDPQHFTIVPVSQYIKGSEY